MADGLDLLRERVIGDALDVESDWRLDALYRELLDRGQTCEVALRRAKVAELLWLGDDQPEIVVALGVSPRTVEGDVAALRSLGEGVLLELVTSSTAELIEQAELTGRVAA
jgi:hypothetical protein